MILPPVRGWGAGRQAWSVAKSLVWPLAAAALVCALMWALRLRGVGDAALYDKGMLCAGC